MTVKEFIENYKKGVDSEIIKTKYLTLSEKNSLIDAILDVLVYEEDGMLVYDKNELDLNKNISIIKAYTNLQFEQVVSDYDLLLSENLDYVIFNLIGNDMHRFNTMLTNKLHNMIDKHNSIPAIVNRNLSALVDSLTETLSGVTTLLSSKDSKKAINSLVKNMNELTTTIKSQEK